MSRVHDRTRWRWFALGLLVASLILMIAPTLPYVSGYQDPDTQVILTRTDHVSWFDPLVVGGGANFSAWLAILALLVAGTTTALATVRIRAAQVGPYRSPMVASAIAALLALVALLFAGGESGWAWLTVALLAAAAVANYLPTRPAGSPLLRG